MDEKRLTEAQVKRLTHLGFHITKARELDQQTFVHVHSCRDAGCSWSMIAMVLGCTTQAAWQRYRTERAEAIEPRMTGEIQLPFEHAKGQGNHSTVAEYKSCEVCGAGDSER